MNRRDFASILGASLLIPSLSKGSSIAREKPFELNYAPHFGMFKNHAGPSELDQLQFMYDQGFTALEDNELMGRPVALQEKIGEKLAKLMISSAATSKSQASTKNPIVAKNSADISV